MKEHAISMLVANKPGVLIRIALIFSRRGYNIDSLVVSPSPDPRFSVLNLVSIGRADEFTNVMKQINRLIDVIHATETTDTDIIKHELALIKISCKKETRIEILQMASALKCDIIDIDDDTIILEITGLSEKIERVRKMFTHYGVLEWMRTGKILMTRGISEPTRKMNKEK